MFSNLLQDYSIWTIILNVLDVAVVAYVLYRLLCLIRGTRAVQLIKGIVILLIVAAISNLLHLNTIQWILSQLWAVIFIALAVIFQPELRRALEQIGRSRFFMKSIFADDTEVDFEKISDEIVRAAIAESKTKTGMLLVIEKETGLNDYVESGVRLEAQISEEVLINIFVPNTPLHDGAAIIRGNRILAAACFLPLSDNPYISTSLGTRHRAAIGISEVSDALVIVVSEETGNISIAKDGKLVRALDEKGLRKLLQEHSIQKEPAAPHFWQRRGNDAKNK